MPAFGNRLSYISALASFPYIVMEANVLKLASGLFTLKMDSIWCALWLSLCCNWPCAMDVTCNMVELWDSWMCPTIRNCSVTGCVLWGALGHG